MRWLQVDGVALACEDSGAGPPLLLLHGGFVSRREWAPQVERLSGRFRLVRFDMRGHGDSERTPGEYSVERWAKDALGVMDALEIERCVCVGHSLGGMVAQVMARRAPERVAGLVLADTTYSTSSTAWESLQTMLSKGLLRLVSVERMAEMSARQLSARRPDVAPFIQREMSRHADDPAHYRELWRAVFDFDSRLWLAQIHCPALILVAEDNDATRRQAGEMATRISGPAHVELIPSAGHMLHWDNPEAFDEAIERFILDFELT